MLLEPGGTLELLAAFDADEQRHIPRPLFLDVEPERERARERVARAVRALPSGLAAATTAIVPGDLADAIVDELELGHETAVAIASDTGATVAELLHRTRCALLLARPHAATPPATIVVGIDGSPESQAAYRAGRELAVRVGARLSALVAEGGSGFDAEAVRGIVAVRLATSPLSPGDGVIAASSASDLVIVGNRGLHGASGVGSVAMRTACEAACSVLVVPSAIV